MKSVELFIARRYLFGKRTIRFVNVITLISIVGITIGVAALLIVLSIFNGFSEVVTGVMVGFDPHIRIEKSGGMTIDDQSKLNEQFAKNSEVKGSSSYVSGKAMLVSGNKNMVAFIKGVEEQGVSKVSGLKQRVVLGEFTLTDTSQTNGIILGIGLADKLGCSTGDEINLISPSDFSSMTSAIFSPSIHKFTVKGIFSSGNREYDAGYAYISLPASQSIFRMGNKVNGVEARLNSFENAFQVKDDLQHQLLTNYEISTWQDLHKDLYFVMKLERWSGYIILSLIILVACFNLMGSLAMSIIEKKRDIGVLQTMGMTPKRIARSFIYEGLLVGGIGTFFGILLGLLVLYLQVKYQLFALDTTVYIIPALPVKIELPDLISVSAASLGLSFLSAYYPAKKVAQFQPAESIRWE